MENLRFSLIFGLFMFAVSQAYYIPVVHLDCSSLSPEHCKREFRHEFEEGFRYHVIELAKTLTENSKAHINSILQEIPPSDDSQAERRTQLNEMLYYYDHYVETIIEKQNNTAELLALVTNDPNMIKYNLPQLLSTEKNPHLNLEIRNLKAVNEFTDNIGKVWSDLYSGIRISDWQAYNKYEEINNFAKVLRTLEGLAKIEVFKTFLRNVFTFFGIVN